MQQTPEPAKAALRHVLATHPLKIEIPTTPAMDIEDKTDRNAPGMEPRLALAAPPRAQAHQRAKNIAESTPV